jgi:hypothetical protein
MIPLKDPQVGSNRSSTDVKPEHRPREKRAIQRLSTSFLTAFSFAIALDYTNLSKPTKVISFLLLPFHPAFDPSLVYLAVGVLPLSFLLYTFFRGNGNPRLGGTWDVLKPGKIDIKLISGAVLFGVGWGIGGYCRASRYLILIKPSR